MFKSVITNMKNNAPLVHCITNYVTVNDCANVVLACGASPIMADDILEVEEITSICNALDINIGTLNKRTVESMLVAGKKANELNHPVVLDPVGAGASILRTKTSLDLIKQLKIDVIRGNISEIKTVLAGNGNTKGVDADVSDKVTSQNIDEVIDYAKKMSEKTGMIVAITGEIDIVCNDKEAFIIRNGHQMMSRITGTGCMLTALIAAYCGANPNELLRATALAVSMMGICGEIAYEKVIENNLGTSSFRTFLIDEISKFNYETLERRVRIEAR